MLVEQLHTVVLITWLGFVSYCKTFAALEPVPEVPCAELTACCLAAAVPAKSGACEDSAVQI